MSTESLSRPRGRIGGSRTPSTPKVSERLQQGGQDAGIDGLSAALNQPMPENAGRLQNVAVELIDLDAGQVRKLGLSVDEVRRGIASSDPDYARKNQSLESIQNLADSIDEGGLHQPITLTRQGDRYQILIGERRYLAHCLLNRQHIYSIISSKRRSGVERTTAQLVENIQHEKLPLQDLVSSLMDFGVTFREETGTDPSFDDIQKRFGLARSTTYQYLKVIKSDRALRTTILKAIGDGRVHTLIMVADLCGKTKKELMQTLAPKVAPPNRYSMGTTSNPQAMRIIADTLHRYLNLPGLEAPDEADWDDPKIAQRHWKKLIDAVEQTCE